MLKCEHLRERLEMILKDHEGVWAMIRCVDCHTVRKESNVRPVLSGV
jgi:Zn-finger protein